MNPRTLITRVACSAIDINLVAKPTEELFEKSRCMNNQLLIKFPLTTTLMMRLSNQDVQQSAWKLRLGNS